MKLIRICSMITRASFILALLLGLAFWFNLLVPDQSWRGVHMLLGFIFVLGLWGIGLAQGFTLKNGSFVLGVLTFIVGLAVAIVGLNQDAWRASVGVEAMNGIHLVLNLVAMGLAEMVAGRSKRLAKEQASA